MEAASVPAAVERSGTKTKKRAPSKPGTPWWLWLAVAGIVLFCLFPFYWLINTSLKTGADLSNANLLPPSPTLDNYTSIFEDDAFTKAIRNSAIIAGSVTLVSLLIGSFAGYALARIHLPFKFLILAILLSISTFPPIAIAAPIFDIWTDIGLYNTYLGLILPSLAFGLPLTVYILASFFRDIPRELEEAAMIDGATRFQAFRKIVVPLGAPGVVTAGLLVFIFAWNEFLFAITLTSTPDRRPVPAAIAYFTGSTQFEVPLGTISAASVIVTIPLIALVLIFQRRIVAGLTAGAVKG
jgi:multiple sugar transport system permease protein